MKSFSPDRMHSGNCIVSKSSRNSLTLSSKSGNDLSCKQYPMCTTDSRELDLAAIFSGVICISPLSLTYSTPVREKSSVSNLEFSDGCPYC